MFAILQVRQSGGIDWTQVVIACTVMITGITAAVFAYLGVRSNKQTQRSNTADHGRVVDALNALRRDTTSALDSVRADMHDLREAHLRHLEQHVQGGK